MSFWQDYRWVILFYSTIIILVFLFRKKFAKESKIIMMYKTKIGLKLMDKWGSKYNEQVKLLSLIGIGVGYAGLFAIFYMILKNIIQLFTVPQAQSAISVVIPGVKVPGSPIMIPLIIGWIALFFVILVHEFSHGVVARAHKIEVKSSGIFFLGPLMGAFVEPEEKKLRKKSDIAQYSVYAAGPFSNILLALFCIALISFVFAPINTHLVNEVGVELAGVTEGFPAAEAGLDGEMVITRVNGVDIANYPEFVTAVQRLTPNETVSMIADGKEYSFATGAHPEDPNRAYLGVMANSKPKIEPKNNALWFRIIYRIIVWLGELVSITGLLSFGIGLANLLPLGPVDGGRMVLTSLQKIKPKTAYVWWKRISLLTLFLLLTSILWPGLKYMGILFGGLLGLI